MIYFIFACLIATLFAPLVIAFYKKKNWLDDPKTHTHLKVLHTNAVPRGGGVVVFFAILIASLLFLEVDKYLIAILFGGLFLTIVGIIDDIYDISPWLRLLVGFGVAVIVVGSGIGIPYVSNPFGEGVIRLDQPQLKVEFAGYEKNLWILADVFAIFFIVWNMNIVNWSKGVDGQMPSFVAIALLIVGVLSTKFLDDPTQFNTAHLCFIAAGAFTGLMLWNWYPQKLLPGYGAGSLAGYFLSVTAILSGAKVATTLMVLAVPTADAIFTFSRRIIAGKSPMKGDRGHLHHKLLDVYHWSKPQIALFYSLSSLSLGLLSLKLNSFGKLIVIATVILLVFAFLIYTKQVKQIRRATNARD